MSMEDRISGIDWNAGGKSGVARFGPGDEALLVVFYSKAVENPAKSLAAGRRICENQVYVRIQTPGEGLNIIDRPVTDSDKMRFRGAWSAFLQNRQHIPEGTPIDLLFPNNPAFAENLRALGVYTIEQCANLSANAIDNIGRGGQECVNRAKKYLESSNSAVPFHQLQKEVEEYKSIIRTQTHQIEQLKVQLDKMMMRDTNPIGASLAPPFVQGYDAQADRLNANHPTKEIADRTKKSAKKSAPVVEEIDAVPAEPTFDLNA